MLTTKVKGTNEEKEREPQQRRRVQQPDAFIYSCLILSSLENLQKRFHIQLYCR